jgi:intracellular septation protein A
VGPILSVLVLGAVYEPSSADYAAITITEVVTTRDVAAEFARQFPSYGKEVSKALLPILGFFLLFQAFTRMYKRRPFIKILVGMLYTFIGLVLFLTGANVGFMPVGYYIGGQLASSSFAWGLVPLGMCIGYFIVAAEPAIHVLNKQVEEVTQGSISQKAMLACLSIGVAASLAFGMIRVLTGISILYFLVPGYVISLVLAFFVPKVFTGIAFDSGGVASGPMTATFVLPYSIGAAEALGADIMTDAFGIVAMVAMTPLITIQILGLVYKIRIRLAEKRATEDQVLIQEDEILDYDDGED